jgi:hypothetical protein
MLKKIVKKILKESTKEIITFKLVIEDINKFTIEIALKNSNKDRKHIIKTIDKR